MAKWRHDENATRTGTLWVKYQDLNVQRCLSEAYLSYRRNRSASSIVCLDAYNELTSSSEVKYEVDVGTMWQIKVESKFRRPICVTMETIRDMNDVSQGYGIGAVVKGNIQSPRKSFAYTGGMPFSQHVLFQAYQR